MRFYPYALAETPGELVFYVPEDHQMASLRNWSSQPSARTKCAVKTLDDLAPELPAPQLIKMDVEGAELLVLKGSERFWESLAESPMVLFEQIPMAAEAFGYAAIEAQCWLRDARSRIPATKSIRILPTCLPSRPRKAHVCEVWGSFVVDKTRR